MTTRALTLTDIRAGTPQGDPAVPCKTASWTGLTDGDDGDPLPTDTIVQYMDRTFQINGTFGSGGTLVIEGTNDGTNWYTLDDPQGIPLSITTAGIYQVIQVTLKMRPRVSAGTGVNLIVTGLLRRTHFIGI
jgi:hypothetical protein